MNRLRTLSSQIRYTCGTVQLNSLISANTNEKRLRHQTCPTLKRLAMSTSTNVDTPSPLPYDGSNDNQSSLPSSSSSSLNVDEIRELLRPFDGNCNGKLELHLDDQTGIAKLCINSPMRKNAFSGLMMAQFSDILTKLEQWKEGRAVIIYGADRFFCSGADLKTVKNMSEKTGAFYISTVMQDNLLRLERLPLVSVALVEGKAIGGGAELVTACDLRVFTANAQIGFVHARLGVTPGFGGGVRLIRLVGRTKALQLLLSARPIDVREASNHGLVQHTLPDGVGADEALNSTIEWYQVNYGNISSFASRNVKQIIHTSIMDMPFDEAIAFEAKIFQQVWGTPEHKKAISSNIKHN
ncbi:hypothetical protein RDWZM_004010 [Blomia tropicalis]|uniref:Ethylmalonyl-CoA decarboxylase n=1 Tax=Blomia tropicalis TaxID=40697 RepID=A0A9Q0MGB2_BLOTA|nr:hypothetical protein RDWZM_004010 [Blomia tropicalis]